VEKERIETEMRTATGIINEKHQAVAAVVLITAGYAADGKYSHFFLSQVPLKIGNHLSLTPGTYCVGWTRGERGLLVHFFDAATGVDRGAEVAEPATQRGRIESFRIVPPSEHPDIQIGRFLLHYSLE
jgi:multisubunit Na+/H+ antiporter MnhE subunit